MLRALPKSWFSWNYSIVDGSQHIADIDVSAWREKGLLTLGGQAYSVYREGLVTGAFMLESDGTILARAVKPSALRRLFTVEYQDKQYILTPASALGRKFVLMDGDEELGSVTAEGIFSRKGRVDLPDSLPMPFRMFILWLTLIMWKRDSEAASS